MRAPQLNNKRPLRTAKFTDKEVLDLRFRAQSEGIDVRAEADKFGVAPETIRKVLRGDTFRWVGALPREEEPQHYEAPPDAQAIMQRLKEKGLLDVADKVTAEIAASPLHNAKAVEAAKKLGAHLFEEDGGERPTGDGGVPQNPLDE